MTNNKTMKILNFFILIFIVGIATFLIPQSIGLGAGGFDSNVVLQQFSFYIAGGIFLVLIIVAFIYAFVIKKGDEKYGSSIGFSDLGDAPALPLFKRFSPFQFAYLSAMFFGIIGLFTFVTKQNTFTGIGTIEQQFTPTAQLLFSTGLIPGSENLGLALVIAATFLGLREISRRTKMTSATYKILAYLFIPIIGGFYWYINHLLRYGSQDLNKIVVFFFGYIQSLLTVLTGSFIIGWIMHMANNLFFSLQTLFQRDQVLATAMGILVLAAMGYAFLFKGRLFGRRGE